MSTVIVFQNECEVPTSIGSLRAFRRWAASEAFPEPGRIDYLQGRIEVDMVPEDFFSHGAVKVELAAVLATTTRDAALGYIRVDRTRITNADADLSAEPDLVFISNEARSEGRVEIARNEHGRCMEVIGSPDLVVEIVSDSSEHKDLVRLPKAYFDAGVREFWLIDARGEELVFIIHRRSTKAFAPVRADSSGFQTSAVLRRKYRLTRRKDHLGEWEYRLEERER